MQNRKLTPEAVKAIEQKAKFRAGAAKWDLNAAIFLFAVLIVVIIMLFIGISVEIVSLVAAIGLAMVWVLGWGKGKELYKRFYYEELQLEIKKAHATTIEETIEETIQKALLNRWS